MKKTIFFLLFLLLLNLSFAQTQTPSQQQGIFPLVTCPGLECKMANFIESMQRLIRAFLVIGYWLTAIVALVGAFMVMLGGYQKGWLNTGKKLIVDSLVYYVILLLAGILFDLFLDFFRPQAK